MHSRRQKHEGILITGASGFVGGHLAQHFFRRGFSLKLSVRNKKQAEALQLQYPGSNVIETGDLSTCQNLDHVLDGITTVIHCAGLAHKKNGACAEELYYRSNAQATQLLSRAASERQVRKFIYLSSVALVAPNSNASIIDDTTCIPRQNSFVKSKLLAEKYVLDLGKTGNTLAVSIRAPLIVGANAKGNWHSLQKMCDSWLPLPFKSIHNRRSLLSIPTLIDAIYRLLETNCGPQKSGNYLLADPDPVSIKDIVVQLRKGMGRRQSLVALPKPILLLISKILGAEEKASALFGNLQINSERFCSEFGLSPPHLLLEEIERSGSLFKEFNQ